MQEIILGGTVWQLNEAQSLGPPGGFGAVFVGHSANLGAVAIKRLHLNAKSSRELEIADFLLHHNHPHVIPIYAAGIDETSGQYFIVMARADQSLQDLIDRAAPLAELEALEIVDAILAGLNEICDLVHRDLKPGNVLLHNGVWKLADLGLARFVEASTALNTMKDFLSPQYAAPEQWQGEHASKGTDIYALGCIIYALLTGRPPFDGHTHADFAEQHRLAIPPPLQASPALRRIVAECLAKNAHVRPGVLSLATQVRRLRVAAGSARSSPIAQAAALIAEVRAAEAVKDELERKVTSDRQAVAREAIAAVQGLLDGLVERIFEEAPNAERNNNGSKVTLGTGRLDYNIEFPYLPARETFGGRHWDVIAGAHVQVGLTYSGSDVMARSANLWFGRLAKDEGYRWWEVAYASTPEHLDWMANQNIARLHVFGFHATGSYRQESLDSLFSLPQWYRVAANPRPIDGELLDDFHERWMAWVSRAATYQSSRVNPFKNAPPPEDIDSRFA